MGERAARRLLFATLVLTVPVPMLVAFDVLAPPVRYWILAAATAAFGVSESFGNPAGTLLLLLAAHALVSTLLAWVAARGLVRILSTLPGAFRVPILLGLALLLLAWSLTDAPYRTPLGRELRTDLTGILS